MAMKRSLDVFVVLRNTVVVVAILVTLAAMLAPATMTFRVAGWRVTPFDLMAVTVPALLLLLVFECIRAIVRTIGIRRQSAASDQAFYEEFRRRSREGSGSDE